MKQFLFCAYFFLLMQPIAAQMKEIPVYYPVVEMPAALKNNYYGRFDPKLLAEDAAALLQKATGQPFTPLPFQKGASKGIFLILDPAYNNSSNEAGTVESDGKSYIRIKARYATGISFALYSWLQDLGFRFYLPGEAWTITPALSSVFNKKTSRKTYRPYFKLRMFGASGGTYAVKGLDDHRQQAGDWQQWHQRNRMGCDYLNIDGHIGEYFNMVHKTEIEKDPSIVAPVNGKRQYSTGAKLDPTNQKGVQLFSDWIVSEFKKQHQNYPSFLPFKKYYTADAGDGLDYCHTPECEQQFKSVSDQMFSITNETARKIKKADSRAGVSTLAYTERADTPSIKIEPNVHVMVVPTAFQSVSTAAELMKRWSKKTTHISQYDYLNIGVWSYDMPFFNLAQHIQYLRYLQSLKAEGVLYETSLSKFASGIQQYFILRFLNEPYANIDTVLDEFCRKNFEHAATPVKALLKEWYFSNVHIQTNYDRPSFYDDELGRFVQYLVAAENMPGVSPAVKTRIGELKAYMIYLCKYYELFADLKSMQEYTVNPSLRNQKVTAILTFTWQMYQSRIFHNTQLNDVLIPFIAENERERWNYNKSSYISEIQGNAAMIIEKEFKELRQKYLPAATPLQVLKDDFFAANSKYSPDSICISTMDESAFGNFVYPIPFYCSSPGLLKIRYKTDTSIVKHKKGKIAVIAAESNDYSYIQNYFIEEEKSTGTIQFKLPAKGHYRLYLGQYQATHTAFTIYPGKNLFYQDKKSIMMNGLLLQDNAEKNACSNKYLAFITPQTDSIRFSNLYYSSTNTSRLYTASGNNIPVIENKSSYYNAAPVPSSQKLPFVFYENIVYRWPPVLKNTAPYYFFLKFPIP